MARIRRDDTVMVITGKDKGKVGRVLRVTEGGKKVVVEKLNMARRHQKATQQNPQGGIVDKEMPLDISNVMAVGPDGRPTRVQYRVEEADGRVTKTRVAAKSGQAIG